MLFACQVVVKVVIHRRHIILSQCAGPSVREISHVDWRAHCAVFVVVASRCGRGDQCRRHCIEIVMVKVEIECGDHNCTGDSR